MLSVVQHDLPPGTYNRYKNKEDRGPPNPGNIGLEESGGAVTHRKHPSFSSEQQGVFHQFQAHYSLGRDADSPHCSLITFFAPAPYY